MSDAVMLVRARGELMAGLPAGGAMLAVAVGEGEVGVLPAGVSVAAVNADTSLVVSGPEAGIVECERRWADRRIKRLVVSHAFHSVLMEPMLERFASVVEGLTLSAPRIALVSNVTGCIESELFTDPGYWVRQVREPVRFADQVTAARGAGGVHFLEIGPDAVLAGLIDAEAVIAVQRRGRDQVATLMGAVAQAHCHGVTVDWAEVFRGRNAHRVDLPGYPFQHQHYWLTPPPTTTDNTLHHPILTTATSLSRADSGCSRRTHRTSHTRLGR